MRFFRFWTALLCALAVIATPVPVRAGPRPAPTGMAATGQVDAVIFGDPVSEREHGFAGPDTVEVDGALGQRARVARPLSPPKNYLGDLRFVVRVDSERQNYLSLKLWGEDASAFRTVLLVDGEQAGFRNGGDYEPINMGTGKALPGRFFLSTAMLPLVSTQGRERVEVIVRTFNSGLTGAATADSRRYYRAVVDTAPKLVLDGMGAEPAPKVAPALSPAQEQALIDSYRTAQIDLFNSLSARSDAAPDAVMSVVRYQDELRFYAEVLSMDWSPAQSDEAKRIALNRVFKSIDNLTKRYYGNVLSLGNGGHQSDWGGYYAALGEALYIVEPLIDAVYGRDAFRALLAQPFATGTVDGPNSLAGVDWRGGQLTRGEAWERVLKANFDRLPRKGRLRHGEHRRSWPGARLSGPVHGAEPGPVRRQAVGALPRVCPRGGRLGAAAAHRQPVLPLLQHRAQQPQVRPTPAQDLHLPHQ